MHGSYQREDFISPLTFFIFRFILFPSLLSLYFKKMPFEWGHVTHFPFPKPMSHLLLESRFYQIGVIHTKRWNYHVHVTSVLNRFNYILN